MPQAAKKDAQSWELSSAMHAQKNVRDLGKTWKNEDGRKRAILFEETVEPGSRHKPPAR